MRILKLITFSAVISACLLAQDSQAPPVQAKRLPPDKSLEQYDFAGQLKTLQAATPALAPNAESAVPAGFKPKTDVQLTVTAQEAVQMSEKWMDEHNQPAVGRDGRVLYSYGAGLPTVVCAPLRVCMIELQSGEKLVGEPHIGDSVRWNLSPPCTALARPRRP